MTFPDLNIEGFGKSAISDSFWEIYCNNIKLAGCGALQEAEKSGKPLSNVIDISNNDSPRKNISYNTIINKLTFSSCFGTFLKLAATTAQSSNFNINGIYAETYFGDGGRVDELPLVYFADAIGNSIKEDFITINSTGVSHSGSVFEMNSILELKLSNLTINFNPISNNFETLPTRRLKNIAQLSSINSKFFLNTLTINNQAIGIGYESNSAPPLI